MFFVLFERLIVVAEPNFRGEDDLMFVFAFVFRVLEVVSPDAGDKYFLRLFCIY